MFFKKSLAYSVLFFALPLICTSSAQADTAETPSRPAVQVLPQANVKGETITLGEIARISAKDEEAKEIAHKLAAVELGASPPPNSRTTLVGARVLMAIEDAGISPQSIGYFIPKIISIKRLGRTISKPEVLEAVRDTLSESKAGTLKTKNVQVKNVIWDNEYVVPTGKTYLRVKLLGQPDQGRLPIRVEAFVDEKPEARFLASALVDYWREVPVLTRALDRGMLISPPDLQVVRMNLNKLSHDIVYHVEQLIGRRVKRRLPAGEVVLRNTIDIPPIVSRGQPVTMTFKTAGLLATATGTSLENGLKGDEIRIQNDRSKRIIRALVIGPHQVEVSAK